MESPTKFRLQLDESKAYDEDFQEFIDTQRSEIVSAIQQQLNEIGIIHEILRYSEHDKLFNLWSFIYQKLDVFNFMMRRGYEPRQIHDIETKYNMKLSLDLRLSLMLCREISFPLIFINDKTMIGYFEQALNKHSKDLFIDFKDYNNEDRKMSHHEWYQCIQWGRFTRSTYALSPEYIICPLYEWSYLTPEQIEVIFCIDDYYFDEEYDISEAKCDTFHNSDNLTNFLKFCHDKKCIQTTQDLHDRFILIGQNRKNDLEIDWDMCCHGVDTREISYLIYDKDSSAILCATGCSAGDGNFADECMEDPTYFYYSSFCEYLESHIFFEIDNTLRGIVENVEIPTEKKLMNYIKEYIGPETKECVVMGYEFLKNDKENILEGLGRLDIEFEEIIQSTEIPTNKQNAMISLKKYFVNQEVFGEVGEKFWNILRQKMQYKVLQIDV